MAGKAKWDQITQCRYGIKFSDPLDAARFVAEGKLTLRVEHKDDCVFLAGVHTQDSGPKLRKRLIVDVKRFYGELVLDDGD